MESFEFIESAIVFGLDNKRSLREFKYSAKDFAKFGEVYSFVVSHFDKYGEFPSPETLVQEFSPIGLHPEAQSVNFDYAMDSFKDQVLQRQIISAVRSQKDAVQENPKKALSSIMISLTDIEVAYDEDVTLYDEGSVDRLDAWRERTKERQLGDGLMGVTTSFKGINGTGVGWMPGELIAVFARPTVGKTWLMVHSAVTAMMQGKKTLLISTEMPIASISLRIDVVLGALTGYKLSHKALRTGQPIDEAQYSKFLQEQAVNKSLLVCDHIAGQSTISLEAIASLIRKHNPEFVVIDGVYLISQGENKKAMWEQSHTLFYGLKNLCLSMNTAIMVSTQANRDASNMFVPPRADQVAFGDALIRAADVALGMCKMEDAEDKRIVQYQKYRDGELPSDIAVLQWDVDCGDIKEIPDFTWDSAF
jgi:replicative DNA helicase